MSTSLWKRFTRRYFATISLKDGQWFLMLHWSRGREDHAVFRWAPRFWRLFVPTRNALDISEEDNFTYLVAEDYGKSKVWLLDNDRKFHEILNAQNGVKSHGCTAHVHVIVVLGDVDVSDKLSIAFSDPAESVAFKLRWG